MVESYFIPDFYGPKPNAVSPRAYPPANSRIQRGLFVTGSSGTPYFVSRAQKETAVVIGATGLNTVSLMNPQEVKTLNDAGISVVWVALPPPKRGVNVNDAATHVVRQFLTSPLSPAHAMFPEPVPRFLATHSTSGRIVLELMHEEATAKKLSHIFSGAVYVAPYLDTANGSILFNPNKARIFRAYAQACADYTPHESAVGRLYMAILAKSEGYRRAPKHETEMTYGQILQLQDSSRRLMENFNPRAAAAIPSIFLVGNKDPFACHKTTEHFAKLMGADVITAKGAGHYPMKDAPNLLSHFVRRVELCIRQRASVELISEADFNAKHRKPIPFTRPAEEQPDNVVPIRRPLRDRLGGALQGAAGLLNAPARILQ